MADDSLALELVASRAEIARALDALEEFAGRLGIDESTSFNLYLAADEILANIISHGYKEDGKGIISLVAKLQGGKLCIEFKDSACGFNPIDAPTPDLSTSPAHREPGGLGVYLTRKVVNEMEYRREGDFNHLTLRWRLGSTTPG